MVPDSHQDLLSDEKRAMAFLATLMPDGSPQVTPIWFDMENGHVRVNTARGRVKERNMTARPQVALAIHDSLDTYRYIQIRGEIVSSVEQGANEHINRLAQKYNGKPFRPLASGEVRVIFEIRPVSVSTGQ